jgi:pathogenesis-related protein 1
MINKNSTSTLIIILIFLASCTSNIETVKQNETILDRPTSTASATKTDPIQKPDHTHYSHVIPKKTRPKPFRLHVDQAQILSSHNRVRARFHLQPLSWSPSLARFSKQWANHLKRSNGCKMQHRSHSDFGENLFWASPYHWSDGTSEIQKVNSAFVVNEWAKEIRYYNYQANRCQPGQQCGHYTQIVWKDSRKVGCGFSICPDKSQVWVCSYDPPGNWQGQRPY